MSHKRLLAMKANAFGQVQTHLWNQTTQLTRSSVRWHLSIACHIYFSKLFPDRQSSEPRGCPEVPDGRLQTEWFSIHETRWNGRLLLC